MQCRGGFESARIRLFLPHNWAAHGLHTGPRCYGRFGRCRKSFRKLWNDLVRIPERHVAPLADRVELLAGVEHPWTSHSRFITPRLHIDMIGLAQNSSLTPAYAARPGVR